MLAGIEIGQIHADPAADDFVRTHPLDMVIGSMHAMPNDLDIYFHEYDKLDCDAFLHDTSMRCSRWRSTAASMCSRISTIRCA